MTSSNYQLRFPVGEMPSIKDPSNQQISNWIQTIENFPIQLSQTVSDLTGSQLSLTYRDGGWSIKQLVHHCADSHMNSFIRFKLALTEDKPTIKPYYEDLWAKLSDSITDNIEDSLLIIKALHSKWTLILQQLNNEQLKREFIHPENGSVVNLGENIGIYAWHCDHHLEHIKLALKNEINL